MTGERFVLLGLARARSEWFRAVAGWATAAAIPAEFVKCVSAEELRARLASGRLFSAALLDARLPAVDRDLLAAAREAGCVPIVVGDHRGRDWPALGAGAVLPAPLTADELIEALYRHTSMVRSGAAVPAVACPVPPGRPPAPLLAVCGAGGTGTSVAAIALAQGLAAAAQRVAAQRVAAHEPPGQGLPVLLADLCLRADQAMLHDARDVVPGVQELVELHRAGRPAIADVHAQTFEVIERGYRLLLGLRRSHHWPGLRPRAFEAALASLRQAFDAVVCDLEGDLEGEAASGSIDIEERNLMARTAVVQAHGVFAVGRADLPGLHGLVRLVGDLVDHGVPPGRIVPVLNQVPRRPRLRAELTRALHALVDGRTGGSALPPLFLPPRPIDAALRDGVALPAPLPALLTGALRGLLPHGQEQPAPRPQAPALVEPGSLGAMAKAPR